jgi:hypothetical protein
LSERSGSCSIMASIKYLTLEKAMKKLARKPRSSVSHRALLPRATCERVGEYPAKTCMWTRMPMLTRNDEPRSCLHAMQMTAPSPELTRKFKCRMCANS